MGKLISIVLGAVFAIVFNYWWLDPFLIPDPCYYHTNEPGLLIQMFYYTGSASNGHPEPNLLNVNSTIGIGGLLGYIVYQKTISQ